MFRCWLPLRVVRGHPRLFAGMAVSLLAGVLLPSSLLLSTRLLIAWNAGTWFYFIATGIMIARATPQSIRRRARMSDEGRFFILVLTSLAAIAAIAAIIAQLATVKDLSGTIKGLQIGLAAATIVSTWFFIRLTYALHYAHEYFDEYFAEPGRPAAGRGGLAFPGSEHPDYYDFLYFSCVIGIADGRRQHFFARDATGGARSIPGKPQCRPQTLRPDQVCKPNPRKSRPSETSVRVITPAR